MGKARQWKELAKKDIRDVTLPSGFVVSVRDFTPEGWAMNGALPESAVRTYLEISQSGDVTGEKMFAAPGGIDKMREMAKQIICHCVVDPKVRVEAVKSSKNGNGNASLAEQLNRLAETSVEDHTASDDDDSILFDDIPEQDRFYLFQLLTNQLPKTVVGENGLTVGAVHNFREGTEGNAAPESGDNGPALRSEDEQPSGNKE